MLKITTLAVLVALITANSAAAFAADPPTILNLTFTSAANAIVEGAPAGTPIGTLSATTVGSSVQANLASFGNQDKCILSGSKSPATVSLPVVATRGNHACTFSAALGGAVGTPYFQTVVFNVAAKQPPPLPDPTLQISANPLQVAKGGSVTVTWSGANIATGATPCMASGIWAGSKAASGTERITPAASGVATLSCPGLSGKTATQSSSNVTVSDSPPPPVADTTPTNATVGAGEDALVLSIGQDYYLGPATYTIKVDGVQIGGTLTAHALHSNPVKDVVTVNGSWVGGSHSVQVQMLEDAWGGSADKDRNLYVESGKYNGASVSGASLYLNTAAPQTFSFVDPAPPPTPDPTLTLSANPLTVITGGKSTLNWSAQNAASCTASGGWTGSRPLAGTESVGPTADTNYAMDCVAATGKHATASVTVRLGQAPPAGAMGPLHRSIDNPAYFAKPDGTAVYFTGSHTWNDLQNEGSTFPPAELDYTGYLNWMQGNNFNFFRMWIVGEQPSGAAWTSSPWYTNPNPFVRTGPGTAADGKLKFDLTKHNPEYFDRMRARVIEAGQHGIYVSVMLFNGWGIDNYSKGGGNPWATHPYNRNNNINGIDGDPSNTGNGDATQTSTAPSAVWESEKAYIRKVVDTVGDLPNVLYEVSNESLPTDANTQWQYNVINYVHSYESGKPQQHPIGMSAQFPQGQLAPMLNSPADWISPSPVGDYRDSPPPNTGPKVILNDTDHLWGDGGDIIWVWKSFTRGVNPIYMDGLGQTGINLGGRTAVSNPLYYTTRKGMTQTAAYAARMDLRIAKPDTTTSSTGYALAGPGQYLVLAPNGGSFTVDLSKEYGGNLSVEWFDINSGNKTTNSVVGWNTAQAFQPPYAGPTALFLKRTSPPVQQPPAGDYVTSHNVSGADKVDQPFQFGRPFVQGEIAHYPQVKINGTAVLTQAEVKNRWPDGSAKYAVVSVVIPSLPLGQRTFLTFQDQTTGNTAPGAITDLLAQFPDFDATIQLTGAPVSVSARKMLEDGNCKPWISGPVEVVLQCRDLSTARVYDLDPTGHGWKPFHPEFELSFWLPTKQVQVRYIGEVSNSMGLEAFTADVKLTAGKANPTVIYQQAAVPHSIRTRWTKTVWIGGAPEPRVNIDHNIAHLSKTGYLWNFDPSVKIPESVRADAYAKWKGSDHGGILSHGLWTLTMGEVGYHPDIGPMPVWYNRTLFSGGDYRMREVMLGQADLAGAFPMQVREGDPERYTTRAKNYKALGLPVTQYVRPYYNGADHITVHSPRCSDWIDDQYCNNGWYPDTAHMPDPFTVPYLTTGDPFYLEGAQLWGAFETYGPEGPYINLRQGRQTRAQAWVLRGIVAAWGLSPDADPMRAAFHDALDDTFAAWEGERGITGTKYQGTPNWQLMFNRIGKPDSNAGEGDIWEGLGPPPLHFWSFGASNPDDCKQWYFSAVCERDLTPWQVGFLGVAMSHAIEMGFADALPTLKWFAENLTGQAMDPSYGAGFMGAFIAPATKHGDNGGPAHFTSWSEVKTAWSDKFKQMVAAYDGGVWLYWWATGGEIYWDVARGGLGTIADKVPNGIAAWLAFSAYNDQLVAHNNHGVSWDNDPTWDILPRQ